MKRIAAVISYPFHALETWLRGSERITFRTFQAHGRLGWAAMIGEIWGMWKEWRWPLWLLSTGLFLLLMILNYFPLVGGYLWLAFAPVVSGIMLLICLRDGANKKVAQRNWLRWSIRCVVLNYTILAWFFFFLVCGAAMTVFFAGFLDWFLIRIPFKRAWSFSLLHLDWIFPLLFFLGVIGKAIRFYVGSFLALPLLIQKDAGVMRAIGASRVVCRGSLGVVAFWMILGWMVSFLPGLFYLSGTGLLISGLVEKLPGTFASLWKIYASSSLLFLFYLALALLAWPFGFLIQAAAYRRVFRQSEGPTSGPIPAG